MGFMKSEENRRALTKAEQTRKERFETVRAQLEAQGYQMHDMTIGLIFANLMALVLGLPLIGLLWLGFILKNSAASASFGLGSALFILAVFLVLIVVHELIHGATWAVFAPGRWNAVSFGFIAKYLTPYCCCNAPLKKGPYILGALMPTLLLGILPCTAAIFTGSLPLFTIGALMILGGGGDLTIILKLLCFRTSTQDVLYLDHPYQAGLAAFTRQQG